MPHSASVASAPRLAVRLGRRLRPFARLMIAAAAWSCASASMPPGGPEDDIAPGIARIRPDTNAVNVRAGGSVTFDFDKVVSERPQGAPDLPALFLISPSFGPTSLSWRRNSISVHPRDGFKQGTTYTVRMLPGLTDLQGNVDTVGRTLVFSTGATIATGELRGIVFDWLAEKPAPNAVIEAFPLPTPRDSARYLAVADSAGRFDLTHVPAGRYLLRGSIDQNKNRFLDPRELFDTMTVALADSARREILAFVHDTIGAGIQTVAVADSLTLRVTMDRALDTAFVVDTSHFSLKAGDSTVVRIVEALSRAQYDQARADSVRTKAVEDSIRRVATTDSVKAADSTKVAAAPPPPAPTRRAPPPRRVIEQAAAALAGRDTTEREPPPKPSIPAPTTEIYLRLERPLRPSTSYRLRAIDMRTLLQYTRTSERVITTPKPRIVAVDSTKDSTRTSRDSTARRDTTTARDTATVRDTIRQRDVGGVNAPRTPATAMRSPLPTLPWSPIARTRRESLRPSATPR
ncbi:MAG: Ig-like domain-containing protein [Gemmatimonadota bacterium]